MIDSDVSYISRCVNVPAKPFTEETFEVASELLEPNVTTTKAESMNLNCPRIALKMLFVKKDQRVLVTLVSVRIGIILVQLNAKNGMVNK